MLKFLSLPEGRHGVTPGCAGMQQGYNGTLRALPVGCNTTLVG